jgi:hypothetical protein
VKVALVALVEEMGLAALVAAQLVVQEVQEVQLEHLLVAA